MATSPLVFSTQNTDPFEFVKATLLVFSMALAGVIVLLSGVPSDSRGASWASVRRNPALWAGIGLFFASACLSAAFGVSSLVAVRGADGSYAGLVTIAALVVILIATSLFVRTEEQETQLLFVVPWSIIAVCLFALVQYANLDPIVWTGVASFGGRPRIFATFGHPNHLAAWLSLGAPIVAGLLHDALRAGQRVRVVFLAFALALACGTVMLSLSRGGWAATAGGLTVFLLARRSPVRDRWHWKPALIGVTGTVSLLTASAVLLPAVRAAVASRVQDFGNMGARGEMWAAAVRVFRKSPVLGCGPDNFALAFQTERTPGFRRIECDKTPTRAHDDVLQVLATQGAVGFASLLLIIPGVVRRLRPQSKRGTIEKSARMAAFAGALGAFVIQGLAGFTVVPTAVLAVTVLALLLREADSPEEDLPSEARGVSSGPSQRRRFGWGSPVAKVAGLTMASLALFVSIRAFLADRLWRQADLLPTGSSDAVELLVQAERLDPLRDTLEVALGESARQAALVSEDPAKRSRLRSLSKRAFARATNLVPANGHNWLGLARLERDQWREGLAASDDLDRAFRSALIRDPRNAGFLADAANAALEAWNLGSAAEFAGENAEVYPDFGPPWGQLGLLELLRGRIEGARRLFDKSRRLDWCGQEAARVVMLYNAAGAAAAASDFAAAAQFAREALDLQPDSVEARYNLARAFEGLGKLDDAKREYRTIIELHPVHPVARNARGRLDAIR